MTRMAPAPKNAFDEDEDDELALNNFAAMNSSANFDMSATFADADEVEGTGEIIAALSKEEIDSFPDDNMPLRHYRAEKGKIPKAIESIKAAIAWRKEFGVKEIATCFEKEGGSNALADLIRKESATGKMYVRGYDADGRAILYMRPAHENTHDENGNITNLVFQLEKAIACSAKSKMEKVCIAIDYEGYRLRDAPPMSTSKKTLKILQDYYPERLHRAYVLNPPMIFRTFWTLIRPFVDPVTKQKIVFCSGSKGTSRVVEAVGPKNAKKLEACAGGTENVRPFAADEYFALPLNVSFDE